MNQAEAPGKAISKQAVTKVQRRSWFGPRLDAAAARRLLTASAWAKPPETVLAAAQAVRDPESWEAAALAAQQVHQEPLFHHFVTRHVPQAPLRLETRNRLETQSKFHACRWEDIRECLEGVVEALEEANICPLLLKGAAALGELYHLPKLRPMRDIDLLVHPGDADAAQKALLNWGFLHSDHSPADDFVAHHHLAPIFHPRTGICVEVHHHPLCHRAVLPGVPSVEEFWRDPRVSALATEREEQSAVRPASRTLVLEPTLHFLVTCLHFTHGDHIAWRSAHFFDLARTIELQGKDIDWSRLLDWATGPELAASLALALACLEAEGLSSAPPDIATTLGAAANLQRWETSLVVELLRRYRMAIPPPPGLVSPRVANILWDGAVNRGPIPRRLVTTVRRVLTRGAFTEAQRRIAASRALNRQRNRAEAELETEPR